MLDIHHSLEHPFGVLGSRYIDQPHVLFISVGRCAFARGTRPPISHSYMSWLLVPTTLNNVGIFYSAVDNFFLGFSSKSPFPAKQWMSPHVIIRCFPCHQWMGRSFSFSLFLWDWIHFLSVIQIIEFLMQMAQKFPFVTSSGTSLWTRAFGRRVSICPHFHVLQKEPSLPLK